MPRKHNHAFEIGITDRMEWLMPEVQWTREEKNNCLQKDMLWISWVPTLRSPSKTQPFKHLAKLPPWLPPFVMKLLSRPHRWAFHAADSLHRTWSFKKPMNPALFTIRSVGNIDYRDYTVTAVSVCLSTIWQVHNPIQKRIDMQWSRQAADHANDFQTWTLQAQGSTSPWWKHWLEIYKYI